MTRADFQFVSLPVLRSEKKNRIMSKHPLSVVGIAWDFEYMFYTYRPTKK